MPTSGIPEGTKCLSVRATVLHCRKSREILGGSYKNLKTTGYCQFLGSNGVGKIHLLSDPSVLGRNQRPMKQEPHPQNLTTC